jgi:hypothetical protein
VKERALGLASSPKQEGMDGWMRVVMEGKGLRCLDIDADPSAFRKSLSGLPGYAVP